MNSDNSANPSGSERLNQIIAEYLETTKAGRAPDRQQLLNSYPDLADDLRLFFTDHDKMKELAEAKQPVGPEPESDVDEPNLPPREAEPAGSVSEDKTLRHAPAEPVDAATLPPTEAKLTSADEAPPVGTKVRYFGDYELLGEIARGGMGVVYKALQSKLNRVVALKMILAGQLASPEDVQRFYSEAEAAANLDHPGIVPIYEIGKHGDQHYFSMAFIDGDSLGDRIKDGPVSPRAAAQFVKSVAEAVQYAHEKGIIHRDLKPANVLIDSSGRTKVTDFGLAKQVKGDSGLTATGQVMGTPSYMPPEQAAGRADIGPAADIYSLGAILYCLIVGRPPFQSANTMDVLKQVLEQEPVPPRKLNSGVDADLETICLKCLEKDVRRRYQSAQELADDLSRFLNDEPITAKPPRVSRLVRVWIRQNVGAIGWAAVVGVFFGLMLAANWLLTDIARLFCRIGSDLDRLGFPTEFHPPLTRLPATPPWLETVQAAGLFALLATTGLLVAALVRPKNRPADVIAGLICGFFAASTLFLFCFSWIFAYQEVNRLTQDVIDIAHVKPGAGVSSRLMNRYPSLEHAPPANQVAVALSLYRYRRFTGAAQSVLMGFLLSGVICIPLCLCETVLGGWLLRRQQTLRATVIPYLEIGLPAGVLITDLVMLQLLARMGFVLSSIPTAVSLGLCIPLAAAIFAAVKQAEWPIRLALQLAWIVSVGATLIAYAGPPPS